MTEGRNQNSRNSARLTSDIGLLDGGVAQLGERLLCKQEVIGSSPFTSTTGEGLASPAARLSGAAPRGTICGWAGRSEKHKKSAAGERGAGVD